MHTGGSVNADAFLVTTVFYFLRLCILKCQGIHRSSCITHRKRRITYSMTTGAGLSTSALSMQSVVLDLQQSFYRRFPKTRESYDKNKEREVIGIVSTSSEWKQIGKPFFRRDATTSIVFRKAPPSRLFPMGRITVCVPYELSFNVAVSQTLSSLHKRPND